MAELSELHQGTRDEAAAARREESRMKDTLRARLAALNPEKMPVCVRAASIY